MLKFQGDRTIIFLVIVYRDTQTDTQTDRHTDGHEYSIVAVDKKAKFYNNNILICLNFPYDRYLVLENNVKKSLLVLTFCTMQNLCSTGADYHDEFGVGIKSNWTALVSV